ncbi:MAG: DNA-3-methyladenine glycosylase I [Desulfuromonadales bacterium]
MSGDVRCPWCGNEPLYIAYHDREWGVPVHDETRLFEFLVLEGAQAGLSWLTILKKRGNYRQAFDGFDADRVARYGAADIARLLGDAGIVRNRLKIESAIRNARAVLAIREAYGSLDRFLWQFVDGRPLQNRWRTLAEIPASTRHSDQLSRELRHLGCNFVGSTICYAFMQATGMVNDHLVDCFRHAQLCQPQD